MKIAVISDIHGNAFALDVVLADLAHAPADQIVCLGDAIQGGAQPAQVVARLRELACPVVLGNADDWLLTGEDTGHEPIAPARLRKMNDIRAWGLTQLSPGDQAFIAAFRPTVEIALEDGRKLLCFHGSPTSFDDILLPTTSEEEFNAMLAPFVPSLMTGGHTHIQQMRRIGASESFYFNPGSVGLAYSHQQPADAFRNDAWAEYAVLTSEAGRLALEFRRVPYDRDDLIAVYRASGRPHAEDMVAQYQPTG